MIPNKPRPLVLQKRDYLIFREVFALRVATRDHIKLAAGFTSTTRINARLLLLTLAGLLRRFFLGTAVRKALYALSPKSAALIDVPLNGPRRKQNEPLVADYFVEHQLKINDLYCALKFLPIPVAGVSFRNWRAFNEPILPDLRLIPDGYVELGTPREPISSFLEVDLGHESLKIWQEKVRNYLELRTSADAGLRFANPRFRVCVIAHSQRRARSIRATVLPLTEKLFWFMSLDLVQAEGFFGRIWLRPKGESLQRFIETL